MSAKVSNLDSTSFAPELTWREHDRDRHGVQFYAEDSHLLDELGGFVGRALEAGDAAVIIATTAHIAGLDQQLRARGLDLAGAIGEGRYVAFDAAEMLTKLLVEGFPDKTRFTETIGNVIKKAETSAKTKTPHVVAFGEMVALLWADGKPEAAIGLEGLWNELARTHSFSLRCAYPMTAFCQEEHSDHFLTICAEHSDVIPTSGYTGLSTNADRLRNIAELQQKEKVYETLQKAKKELERQIIEKTEAQRKLRDSEQSLRELSGQLLRMQDEERRHLGRELHDTVGQYLAALKIRLDLMRPKLEAAGNGLAQQLTECLGLAEQSISEVRTMSYLLYPPMLEEMGLKTAIQWYVEGFSQRSGVQTTLGISDSIRRLPRDLELALFRVLQESLTNVLRHSGSPTAHIRLLIQNETVIMEVQDQGTGIPPATLESARDSLGTLGVGLRGMSERIRQLGGQLELQSSKAGTTVLATAPCGGQESAATRYGVN